MAMNGFLESVQDSIAASITETSTAVIHREDDMGHPPPHPGPLWTRFVCISDTHCRIFPVPPGDVLLHSGDLTNLGTFQQLEITMRWLEMLPHPTKIVIAGNHDIALHQQGGWYEANHQKWHPRGKEDVAAIQGLVQGERAIQAGIVYLEDKKHEFRVKENGRLWSVYGSPWSPAFYNWAFNYDRGIEAHRRISAIEKTDILLTHGPPYQIFDTTREGQVGCEALSARLPSLRPRLHVFGHIHEDHGVVIHDWPSSSSRSNPSKTTTTTTTATPTALVSTTESAIPDATNSAHTPERTVFVNAANWPMGPKAMLPNGSRTPFGRGPYAPVIVDLLDDVPEKGIQVGSN